MPTSLPLSTLEELELWMALHGLYISISPKHSNRVRITEPFPVQPDAK